MPFFVLFMFFLLLGNWPNSYSWPFIFVDDNNPGRDPPGVLKWLIHQKKHIC